MLSLTENRSLALGYYYLIGFAFEEQVIEHRKIIPFLFAFVPTHGTGRYADRIIVLECSL